MTDDIHQVRIQTDFAADGIGILLFLQTSMGRRVLRAKGDAWVWEDVVPATNVAPTLTLSDGHARALMDALLRHYNGTPDSNTQRADLMHERQRRDKLEDHILWALEQQARPARPPLGQPPAGLGGQGGTASATSSGQR